MFLSFAYYMQKLGTRYKHEMVELSHPNTPCKAAGTHTHASARPQSRMGACGVICCRAYRRRACVIFQQANERTDFAHTHALPHAFPHTHCNAPADYIADTPGFARCFAIPDGYAYACRNKVAHAKTYRTTDSHRKARGDALTLALAHPAPYAAAHSCAHAYRRTHGGAYGGAHRGTDTASLH